MCHKIKLKDYNFVGCERDAKMMMMMLSHAVFGGGCNEWRKFFVLSRNKIKEFNYL